MRKVIAMLLVIAMALSLSACCLHDYASATCTKPETCTKCGETQGEALGHIWVEATCTEPKTCSRCGQTEGKALGHKWRGANPPICTVCNAMQPMDEPVSGTILQGTKPDSRYASTLTITTASDAVVVKLKGSQAFSFYVRANDRVTVTVPGEKMYVYFASGDTWYGSKELFGENTSYTKDSERCDFTTYTYSYSFYSSVNGNFSQSPSSASEFGN